MQDGGQALLPHLHRFTIQLRRCEEYMSRQSQYVGTTLTTIIRELILEVFTGQTVHRDEIYKQILDVYRERGGKEFDEIIKRRCRDALGDLSPSGQLSDRHGRTKYEGGGYWTISAPL